MSTKPQIDGCNMKRLAALVVVLCFALTGSASASEYFVNAVKGCTGTEAEDAPEANLIRSRASPWRMNGQFLELNGFGSTSWTQSR
jgi:hypothetical protein